MKYCSRVKAREYPTIRSMFQEQLRTTTLKAINFLEAKLMGGFKCTNEDFFFHFQKS
jgi:hypothetical protein